MLNSLLLCKSLLTKDLKELLTLIEEQNLQDSFVYLRVYLLEELGDYLQSFRLNMNNDKLKGEIFNWI